MKKNMPPCSPAEQGTWQNPCLQYFISLPGCQTQAPFDASMLVWFRKRITMDILNEANEYMLEHEDDGGPMPPSPCEHSLPAGHFPPERDKGKAGIYRKRINTGRIE